MQTMLPDMPRRTAPRSLADFTSAARYPNAAKRWAVTKRAMQIYLATVGEAAVKEYSSDWRFELDEWAPVTTDADYAARLEDIRTRAIGEWECNGGDNCTPGTNRFLYAFALPEVDASDWNGSDSCGTSGCGVCVRESTKYVTVTLTVRFEVDNTSDEETTYADVEQYLSINTDRIDDANSPDVSVDDLHVSTCCHEC